ncbi:MAG: hypothetical protein COB09_17070 [Thalassobium sp.]|nr:MAG: hypothetical protein COB09_17070 [Thalassobium sp.]
MTIVDNKPAIGRPTGYNEENVTKLCLAIAQGEGLESVCKPDDMPGASTVYAWLNKYPEFQEKYACAREAQAERYLDEIIDIADDSGFDYKKTASGEVLVNGDAIQRANLRVNARKWAMSKLNPKRFGDKVTQELSGPNGGAIQSDTKMVVEFVSSDNKD